MSLEVFVRQKLTEYDYQEVKGPLMMDRVLWERSGHWDKYAEAMFTTSSENREYAIKPMNCPGHVQIFNQGLKSYRDLPLRMAEFGSCHRNEPSGALHGIMRVRGFTQDDAHVFCTEEPSSTRSYCLYQNGIYDTYTDIWFRTRLLLNYLRALKSVWVLMKCGIVQKLTLSKRLRIYGNSI